MSWTKIILNGEPQQDLQLNFDAWVVGTGAAESLTIMPDINAFFSVGDGDQVTLSGSIAEYAISVSGNLISFQSLDNGAVTTLGIGGSTIVHFDEGSAELDMFLGAQGAQMNLGNAVIMDGETLADTGTVFGGTSVTTVSVDTGTLQSPVEFDAGSGAFNFTDDVTILNNVVINNFSTDDSITISNSEENNYSFANDGSDVDIIYNNNGTINRVTLTGVVSADATVCDRASFEAASGFDVFGSL